MDVQRCARATESKLVWPPSDPQQMCSLWAQAMCSEGEWKQNPVSNSKRENTRGQRKHRAWNTQDLPLMGFGVQRLRAVSGGNSMSSVPNPASCPIWHSQQDWCSVRRILYWSFSTPQHCKGASRSPPEHSLLFTSCNQDRTEHSPCIAKCILRPLNTNMFQLQEANHSGFGN